MTKIRSSAQEVDIKTLTFCAKVTQSLLWAPYDLGVIARKLDFDATEQHSANQPVKLHRLVWAYVFHSLESIITSLATCKISVF